MKAPWWLRSFSVWTGVIGIVLCFVPLTRKLLHQAELGVVQFQGLMTVVLRFKTEARKSKLSEKGEPEEKFDFKEQS